MHCMYMIVAAAYNFSNHSKLGERIHSLEICDYLLDYDGIEAVLVIVNGICVSYRLERQQRLADKVQRDCRTTEVYLDDVERSLREVTDFVSCFTNLSHHRPP